MIYDIIEATQPTNAYILELDRGEDEEEDEDIDLPPAAAIVKSFISRSLCLSISTPDIHFQILLLLPKL